MNKLPAFMKPIHPNAYRRDDVPLPRITAVYNLIPSPLSPPRFVYEVIYKDGEVDTVPLSGVTDGHWEIVISNFNLPLKEPK